MLHRVIIAATVVMSLQPSRALAADPPVVPPAAEFHKLIISSAQAEMVAIAVAADGSAAWVEATPAALRKKLNRGGQPTRIAVKAVHFDGRDAREVTAWERSAKLLQLAAKRTATGAGEVSFAYRDYDSLAPVPVAIAAGADGWKVAARSTGADVPKAKWQKQASGLLLAEVTTDNLLRTYHIVSKPGADSPAMQLVAVADIELRVGDAKFFASPSVPITADAKTVAAFDEALGQEAPSAEFVRTGSSCAIRWPGTDGRALVVNIPKLERAALSALLADIQERARFLGEPSPEHKLRDLEPLLQRSAIASALARVPAVSGAFTGEDSPAPGKVLDALTKTAAAYGGIVLRNTVTVGEAAWVVYYDVIHRVARVLPESVTWTVSSGDPAVEVTRPDRLSVFYLEARGATVPPPGPDRDRKFQEALAGAVGVADLPPVTFSYGPVGLPVGAMDTADDNVSSLRINWADTRMDQHLALQLTIERQERDYLRKVLLEKTGLPLRLSWAGKAFALDRLRDRVVLPGRLVLNPGSRLPVKTPEANKLEVLMFAGPDMWAQRGDDTADVVVNYEGQRKTMTFRKGSREPAEASFDLVLDDNGKRPILRLQYRTTPAGPWVESVAPVVVIP